MNLSDELKDYISELYESISGDSYADKKLSGGLYLVVKAQSLEEKNKALENVRDDLLVHISNLEAQIEKMKCCGNCSRYTSHHCTRCKFNEMSQHTNDNWQLKEDE